MQLFKTSIIILLFVILIVLVFFTFNTLNTYSETLANQEHLSNLKAYIIGISSLTLLIVLFSVFFINEGVFRLKYNKETQQQSTIKEKDHNNNDVENEELVQKHKEEKLKVEYEKKAKKITEHIQSEYKPTDNLEEFSKKFLRIIGKSYDVVQGEYFHLSQSAENEQNEMDDKTESKKEELLLQASYAYFVPTEQRNSFDKEDGLIGQVAKAKKTLILDNVPEGYITVASGLGKATPSNLMIVPMIDTEDNLIGILEIARFKRFNKYDEKSIVDICKETTKIIKTIINK